MLSHAGNLIAGLYYDASPGTITIHKGQQTATISIHVHPNTPATGQEMIIVILESVDGADGFGTTGGTGRLAN